MSFSPKDVAGLSLWLDAADPNANGVVPSNGSNITVWKDKSSSQKVANAVSGTYPTFSNNSITFSSSSGCGLSISNYSVNNISQMSIFAVANNTTTQTRTDSVTNGMIHWDENGGWGQVSLIPYQDMIRWRFGSSQTENNPFYTFPTNQGTNFNIIHTLKNSTTESLYLNGTNVSTASTFYSTTANTVNTLTIGNKGGTNTVKEIIVISGSLTPSDRQKIEGYLAWKWGMVANLPSSHPYKALSPTAVFLPNIITNLSVWLDANDLNSMYSNSTLTTNATSGQKVLGWKNKANNSYNFTQTDSTKAPTLTTLSNNNVLSFNGNYLTNTLIPFNNSEYTIYIVATSSGRTGHSYLLKGNTVADSYLFFGAYNNTFATFTGTGTTVWWDTAANLDSGNATSAISSSGSILGMVVKSSVMIPYFTGKQLSNKTGTTGTFSGLRIGETDDSHLGQGWIGNICEVLIYNKGLNDSERQTVEGYLAWKWGIQSLPAGHSYKNTPPTVDNVAYAVNNFASDNTIISGIVANSALTADNLLLSLKSQLKNSNLSTSDKSTVKNQYVTSLITKAGTNIIDVANSTTFFSNSNSVQPGLSTKNVKVILPTLSGGSGTVTLPTISSTNYYHLEMPYNTNVTISNAIPSVTLSYDGSNNVTYNSQTKTLGSTIFINGNSYKIVALGSVALDQTAGAGGDPHIYPLIGNSYDLPNEKARFLLFDNQKEDLIRIVCECDFLSEQEIADSKFRNSSVTEGTFMTKVWIRNNEKRMEINMKDLSVAKSEGFEIGEIYEDKYVMKNRYSDLQILKFKIDFDGKSRNIIVDTKNGKYTIKLSIDINCADHRNHIELHGPEIETGVGSLISEKTCKKLITPNF